jgi:hypothetical protein
MRIWLHNSAISVSENHNVLHFLMSSSIIFASQYVPVPISVSRDITS